MERNWFLLSSPSSTLRDCWLRTKPKNRQKCRSNLIGNSCPVWRMGICRWTWITSKSVHSQRYEGHHFARFIETPKISNGTKSWRKYCQPKLWLRCHLLPKKPFYSITKIRIAQQKLISLKKFIRASQVFTENSKTIQSKHG